MAVFEMGLYTLKDTDNYCGTACYAATWGSGILYERWL